MFDIIIAGYIIMDDIYFEAMLSDRVILRPKQLHKGYVDEIKKILRGRVEERCGTYGYVKKDSVEVVQRPVGYVQQGYMNGCITFDVNYKAMICNPVYGNVIRMKLSMIKKEVGLLFEEDFLSVVVPTDLEPNKSSFESLEEGDEVAIFVIDKQIQPDNTIMVVGKIYNEKTDKEFTVDIGDLEKSEEVKEAAMGDSESDSDSGSNSDSDDDESGDESDDESDDETDAKDEFPDDSEDVDIDSDSEGNEGVDDSDSDADSDEEKEIELGDDGESAIEDEEEKDEDALAEKKAQMVADEDGDEDDVPEAGQVDDEESGSDSDEDDEFDYAD